MHTKADWEYLNKLRASNQQSNAIIINERERERMREKEREREGEAFSLQDYNISHIQYRM